MAVVEKKGVSRASAGCHTSTMSEVVNALVAFAVIVFIFRWATSGHPSSFPRCSPSPLPRSLVLLRHAVRRSRTRLQAKARHPRHGMALPSPLDTHSPPPGRPDPHHVPRHPDVRTPAPARTRRLTPPQRQHPLRPLAHRQRRAHLEQDSRARVPRAGTSLPLFFCGRGLNAAQPPPAYFTLYPRPDGLNNAQRRSPQTLASSATTTTRHPSLIERYQLAEKVAEEPTVPDQDPADVGGKAKWEDTPDKREASLRERKAQMVLAARQ